MTLLSRIIHLKKTSFACATSSTADSAKRFKQFVKSRQISMKLQYYQSSNDGMVKALKTKSLDKKAKSIETGVSRGGRVAVRLVEKPPRASAPDMTATPNRARIRGDAVREKVLAVALEYFGTFGFEGTSTRAVAERAQVTHTLVLYHFKSKDKLWIATVEEALRPYSQAIDADIEVSKDQIAKTALATFIEQFVRMSARQPMIHRIMTMESNQSTKRLAWIIEHFLRRHFSFVRDLIRRGQSEGSVRQCDPARLYYLIIAAGGTPFTLRTEYKALTGRDVFDEAEILRNIAFIYEIVFT